VQLFLVATSARTAKSPKASGVGVLSAAARDLELVPHRVLHVFWKRSELGPATPDPSTWRSAISPFHFTPNRPF